MPSYFVLQAHYFTQIHACTMADRAKKATKGVTQKLGVHMTPKTISEQDNFEKSRGVIGSLEKRKKANYNRKCNAANAQKRKQCDRPTHKSSAAGKLWHTARTLLPCSRLQSVCKEGPNFGQFASAVLQAAPCILAPCIIVT